MGRLLLPNQWVMMQLLLDGLEAVFILEDEERTNWHERE